MFNLPRLEGSRAGAGPSALGLAEQSWRAQANRRARFAVVLVVGGGAKLRCDVCHNAQPGAPTAGDEWMSPRPKSWNGPTDRFQE